MTSGDDTRTKNEGGADPGSRPAARPIAVDGTVDSFDVITHDASTGTYHATYDPTVDPTSSAIVATVAAATNESTTTLPSLYSSIDTDALNVLTAPGTWADDDSLKRLEFVYVGHQVVIHEPGSLTVAPVLETSVDT